MGSKQTNKFKISKTYEILFKIRIVFIDQS